MNFGCLVVSLILAEYVYNVIFVHFWIEAAYKNEFPWIADSTLFLWKKLFDIFFKLPMTLIH